MKVRHDNFTLIDKESFSLFFFLLGKISMGKFGFQSLINEGIEGFIHSWKRCGGLGEAKQKF